MQTFSDLQATFLALTPEKQDKVAEQSLLGTFEGIPPKLRDDLTASLDTGDPEGDAPEAARVEQIRHGLDRRQETAKHPAVRNLATMAPGGAGR